MAIIDLVNKKPLIHCLTNVVSMNDCANILLASQASPIMAEDICEVEDITQASDGLCLNLGMLSENKAQAMLLAFKKAAMLNHPIVLDPVGVGASPFRLKQALLLLSTCQIDVVCGNASEIKALALHSKTGRGVDVSSEDGLDSKKYARRLAHQYKCIVVMSGKVDYITDGNKAYEVYNGHELMAKVTGMGCMLSCLLAAFLATYENKLYACIKATVYMGLAGEYASKKASGSGSFKMHFIDGIDLLEDADLKEGAKVEVL